MIGRITGRIVEKSMDLVLVDVSGVAYEIEIPHTTFYRLAEIDTGVVLHTHMVVREDAQLLYGFSTLRERELFRALIKVNKVGPRLAIAILSGMETDAFIVCVREGDIKALNAISGVGKVMAERLIIEMRNKLPQWEVDIPVILTDKTQTSLLEDAESALVKLGFRPQEVSRALAQVSDSANDVESLIKQALKGLT